MTDKMRDEFEAWAALHWLHCAHKPVKMLDGQYQNNELQASWESWQDYRAAIEIDLPEVGPEPEEPEDAIDDSYMDEHYGRTRMRNMCVRAIEAAGLKVKP